jgi:16S rRNA C967 or C1407 C5-methylase (RsmB/RsmF family)/NOL1/NOP2/fmu family ribosome biogenesis protein
MRVPESLTASLQGIAGFQAQRFCEAQGQAAVVSLRRNPLKYRGEPAPGALGDGPIPWCPQGVYLAERPAFYLDPLWHGGVYYVQEASSMSLDFAVRHLAGLQPPLRVLDLCAAPGGKSTLLAAALPPGSLLVANEVIGSRVAALQENLTKWGTATTVVTRSDARDFGRLPGFFDLVVVDAPCSGSGLFRKDPAAAAGWSPGLVELCSGRQRRILADVLPSLAPGGVLLYSTCSFSPEENERIADYLAGEAGLESEALPFPAEWNIVESAAPATGAKGYRFYPGRLQGEGFFLACFRKPGAALGQSGRRAKGPRGRPAFTPASRGDASVVGAWTDGSPGVLQYGGEMVLFPEGLRPGLEQLAGALRVVSFGTAAGRLIRGELAPSPALALSVHAGVAIPGAELSLAQALAFLRKEDTGLPLRKGWLLVRYQGHPLGWLKGIPRGFNNYYPSSWRILRGGAPPLSPQEG